MRLLAVLFIVLSSFYLLYFFNYHPGAMLLFIPLLAASMIVLSLIFDRPKTYWFRKSTYWFPTSWQGWIVIGICIFLSMCIYAGANLNSPSLGDTLSTALPFWCLLLALFITTVHKTGKKV